MNDNSSVWLCETGWLAERLNAPGLVVLDATLFTPAEGRDARAEYMQRRIPGAVFFDIAGLSDPNNPNPNMLPSPERFALEMRKLGVGDGMRIVIYDTRGVYSAPRAWWMFRVMGHNDVAVLNGGMKKWLAEGRPTEEGEPRPRGQRHFTARKNAALVRDLSDMKAAVARGDKQIVDARSKARFSGAEPEPWAVPRLGHMPGACSLPFGELVTPEGVMKPAAEIYEIFSRAGVDPNKPVIATCGSGVTACTLALGLAVIGNEHTPVYDGSWYEWSNAADAPVEGPKTD
ncbi:MAG: 3-mercaptopyruvate sulfurtransferase [Hyphomicrobiales bacterium]|nr:3-mercaptopyruvate sulfurtransferase [Hyphomicrobiales bacterium]